MVSKARCDGCSGKIPRTSDVLGMGLYMGVICRSCGRKLCYQCHDPRQKGFSCPNCGHKLAPLYEDYLR